MFISRILPWLPSTRASDRRSRPMVGKHVAKAVVAWWTYTLGCSLVLASPFFGFVQAPLRRYPDNNSHSLLLDLPLILEVVLSQQLTIQGQSESVALLAVLVHLGGTLPLTLVVAALDTPNRASWLVPVLRSVRAFPGVFGLTVVGQSVLGGLIAFGVVMGGGLLLSEASLWGRSAGLAVMLGLGAVALLVGRPALDLVRVAHVHGRGRATADMGRGLEVLMRRPITTLTVHAALALLGWLCALSGWLLMLRYGVHAPATSTAVVLWLGNQAGFMLLLGCRTAWLRYCLLAVRGPTGFGGATACVQRV